MIKAEVKETFVTVTEAPAGTYWVGDPCYFVPDDDWCGVLNETGYLGLYDDVQRMRNKCEYAPKENRFGIFVLENGYVVGSASTKYGDGCYKDQYGVEYGVDAGMIGFVPIEYAIDVEEKYPHSDSIGQIVEWSKPITIDYNEGMISIGNSDRMMEIQTEDEPDEIEECFYCGDEHCDEECRDYDGQPDEAQEWYDYDPDC